MMNQDPEYVKEVLFAQIQNIEAGLLAEYPNNGLVNQIENGTRYNGNGTVEAFLSFLPTSDSCTESIDLTFKLACKQQQTTFSSEIAWSGGKTIDEVVVAYLCPDRFDALQEQVDYVVERTQQPLVDRMVGILENFCQE
jgi:hypothetical protein